MTRKVNAATLAHIKASEGLRLNAYPDPGSVDGNPWTIGYGSTKGVTKGMVITAADAEARLVDDLSTAENTVSKLVTVPLNDNQFGALVSFTFNVGARAFADSTLLRKLNAGGYASVPSELARWNKNDGKTMAGLTKRRAAEAALWATPASSQPIPTPTPPPSSPLPTQTLPEPVKGRGGIGWAVAAILAGIALAAVVYFIFFHR